MFFVHRYLQRGPSMTYWYNAGPRRRPALTMHNVKFSQCTSANYDAKIKHWKMLNCFLILTINLDWNMLTCFFILMLCYDLIRIDGLHHKLFSVRLRFCLFYFLSLRICLSESAGTGTDFAVFWKSCPLVCILLQNINLYGCCGLQNWICIYALYEWDRTAQRTLCPSSLGSLL